MVNQIKTIHNVILKDGLRQIKFKNSHLRPVPSAEEGKRGAIFAYRSKENMVKAHGVVLTSLEAILENQDNFTHWTPNVYRFGAYSDNPKVIYLVTPPNRTEYNSIVSLFLDQLFNANYELALSNGRKCVNRILHILDEFTNIPAIPHMDTKISIGLGQNILYYLWIQNLKQLVSEYGENTAETIRENCSLKVYIKSTAPATNEYFSKELGTRTITRRRRSSNILDDANPNVSIENPRQELLTPTQLSKLQEGEAVILRGVKGRDNAGRKITTDPIFLHEKTSLPYRYMFLQEEFDQSMTLADIPVESGHRDLDLQDIAVGAQSTFTKIIDWRMALTDRMRTNGKIPQLASRKQAIKALSQSQFTSPADLTQAVITEVFDEEDDDDLFFVDDVM